MIMLCCNYGFSQDDWLVNLGRTGDWYVTTASTRKSYGENYSVSLRVQGKKKTNAYGDGCLTIYETQVSSGGSWEKVSISKLYNEKCAYKFTFGDWSLGGIREDYYFTAFAN